jgi:hypothetical protein
MLSVVISSSGFSGVGSSLLHEKKRSEAMVTKEIVFMIDKLIEKFIN